jgi:hypothetical protein
MNMAENREEDIGTKGIPAEFFIGITPFKNVYTAHHIL